MEKRRRLIPAVFVLMFGMLSGLNIIGNPRFENYRAVDIVHVLATGMSFGAAIALFVVFARPDRARSRYGAVILSV
jgi:hypothetical protein